MNCPTTNAALVRDKCVSIVNIEIKETRLCRSDLRIATKLTGSRESEFPPTAQSALLILKSTIISKSTITKNL